MLPRRRGCMRLHPMCPHGLEDELVDRREVECHKPPRALLCARKKRRVFLACSWQGGRSTGSAVFLRTRPADCLLRSRMRRLSMALFVFPPYLDVSKLEALIFSPIQPLPAGSPQGFDGKVKERAGSTKYRVSSLSKVSSKLLQGPPRCCQIIARTLSPPL